MSKLRIGHKPGVGPALKIMRSEADDPWTTPNSDIGKFIFNSETAQISYMLGTVKFEKGGASVYPPGTLSTPNVYYPRPHHRVETYQSGANYGESHHYDFQAAFGLPYWPMVEVRDYEISSQRVFAKMQRWTQSIVGDFYSTGRTEDWLGGTYFRSKTLVTTFGGSGQALTPGTHIALASVWEMPGDNGTYSFPSAPQVPGQKVIDIRPVRAAMTRPGFDVDTATGRQFIFNSDRIPSKILAAGELIIQPGEWIDIMIDPEFQPLGQFTYVDAMATYPSLGYFYHPSFRPPSFGNWWQDGPIYDYVVYPDRVRFLGTGLAVMQIRYMIVADDGERSSGGGAPVMRADSDTGVVQIVRPGASNPPRLSDIIIDSRLPYIPVVAQGYIPSAGFNLTADDAMFGTHRAPDISFNYPGMVPFVKLSVHGVFTTPTIPTPTLTDMCSPPFITRFFNAPPVGPWNGQHAGFSSVARMGSNWVRIYASPNNPSATGWQGAWPNPPETYTRYQFTLYGVSYAILAIPAS